MSLTATLTASTYGMGGDGGTPGNDAVILTYPIAASASVSAGDWVKLSSTTAGTISKCTSTADNPIGIAYSSVDNTSGSAGDKFAPVLRRGFAYVDCITGSSGTVAGKLIAFDDLLYLSASGATNAVEGQTLTTTAGGTYVVARACDYLPVPTGTTAQTLAKLRVYLDRLGKSTLVA